MDTTTYASKYSLVLAKEIDKKIMQICTEKPEIMENRDSVTLWCQDALVNGDVIKRYWFTVNGEEIARFCVGLDYSADGILQIKASDVVYQRK